jgi:integrase
MHLAIGVVNGVKRANWHLSGNDIEPPPAKRQVGRTLPREQKLDLTKRPSRNPDWENARLAMILSLNTPTRSCELKGPQGQDVDLLEGAITVRRTKTDAGRRLIPLNGAAWEAMMELYRRAEKANGREPDHFLFPAGENGKIDPVKPQKTWRSACEA